MNMNRNISLLVAAAVIIIAGGWALYSRFKTPVVSPTVVEQFEWSFIDRGVSQELSAPQTAVALRVAGVEVQLGTYTGTCFDIKGSSWEFVRNEIAGAICWWAGGGVELGVFEEDGKLVLKKGEIEEGTAEGGGFRGHFVPLINATLQ